MSCTANLAENFRQLPEYLIERADYIKLFPVGNMPNCHYHQIIKYLRDKILEVFGKTGIITVYMNICSYIELEVAK